jgi:hypothetical protein
MLVGSQVAHGLAYRIAYPEVAVRVHVLALAGHGYTSQLDVVCGVLVSVALFVLVRVTLEAVSKGPPRPAPPLAFAVLPPLGFALQELVERWQAVGGLPWWVVLQPSFRIGLALQLPFGLAAYLVARLLLGTAHRLGRWAARPDAPPRTRPLLVTPPPRADVDGLPGTRVLASTLSKRGPPLLAG